MLLPVAPKFRKHRGRRKARRSPSAPPVPPPVPLTLVAAQFNENDHVLTLEFDRAIDADGLAAGQITVLDGVHNDHAYVGAGAATVISPTRIGVQLNPVGPYGGATTTLTASAFTGIVAENDGGTWAGVSGLALPFP